MKRLIFILFIFCGSFSRAQTWYPVPNNFHNGYPVSFGVYQNKMFGSGGFTMIGNMTASGIGQFDGYWHTVQNGLLGSANALAVFNNNLYAGGNFLDASGVSNTHYIAYWNGSSWFSLGSNNLANNDIYSLCVYNGELYAGGIFTQMGGTPCNRIAKWNGSSWQNVGGGFTGNTYVNCMTVYNGQLYVGGSLGLPGGPNSNYYNIVRWNGTQWDSVGNSLNGAVGNLLTDTANNLLYASGGFNASGTTQLWGVGRWDGNSWASVGDDTTTTDAGLIMYNNELYGCGYGPTIYHGTDTLWYLSKWNGTNWVHVSKFNATVETMQVFSGNLYVAGTFTQIDTGQVKYIGCMGPNCLSVGMSEQEKLGQSISVYPNPSDGKIFVEFSNQKNISIVAYNIFGEKIVERNNSSDKTELDLTSQPPGIYLLRFADSNGNCVTKKIVKE